MAITRARIPFGDLFLTGTVTREVTSGDTDLLEVRLDDDAPAMAGVTTWFMREGAELTVRLSAVEILDEARNWTADCLGYPDTSVIDNKRATRYVERHYPGGYEQFERDMGTATLYPVIPQ